MSFILPTTDVLLSFLPYQYPTHMCLSARSISHLSTDGVFSMSDFLLELAHCVHGLVSLLPADTVEASERRELLTEPYKNMSTLCEWFLIHYIQCMYIVRTYVNLC